MPEVSNSDYKRLQKLNDKENSATDGAPFKWSASTGKVLGFSGIPGVTNLKFKELKRGAIFSQKPRQLQDTPPVKPTDGPTPPKPTKPTKGKDATTADVEAAVRKGFITPEEAAGSSGKGATGERWYESNADGTANYSKPTKIEPMSKTYAKKLGQAQGASQATGKPMGKQFTGPTSMKIETGRKAGFQPYAAPVDLSGF